MMFGKLVEFSIVYYRTEDVRSWHLSVSPKLISINNRMTNYYSPLTVKFLYGLLCNCMRTVQHDYDTGTLRTRVNTGTNLRLIHTFGRFEHTTTMNTGGHKRQRLTVLVWYWFYTSYTFIFNSNTFQVSNILFQPSRKRSFLQLAIQFVSNCHYTSRKEMVRGSMKLGTPEAWICKSGISYHFLSWCFFL